MGRQEVSTVEPLVFEDALPVDIPQDEPPTTQDLYSCVVCGTPLTYGGRGRKPKYCDDHKRASAPSTRRAKPNEKLAEQATQALVQINRLTGFGARILGLEATSETIMFCEDEFARQAKDALLSDPDLCKQILAAGQISGKVSLAIAYALMGAQVAPVAIAELKAKQAAKEANRKAKVAQHPVESVRETVKHGEKV